VANTKRIITLRLEHPHDLFQLPQTDLFSEYRNYLTGVEHALSELRSHSIRQDLELRLRLPTDTISEGLGVRIERALGRYCDERLHYNNREKRANRLDGATGLLRIGLPITIVGLVITYYTAQNRDPSEAIQGVYDHLGWIFAWIGLWWPLDTMLFNPHVYSRENRALRALRDATVVVEPRTTAPTSTELGEP